ncbi:MAG: hypothetical protein V4644_02890 [Patescibacteria group bacterium]
MTMRIIATTGFHPSVRICITRPWEGESLTEHPERYTYLKLKELGDKEFRVERHCAQDAHILISDEEARTLAGLGWTREHVYQRQLMMAA